MSPGNMVLGLGLMNGQGYGLGSAIVSGCGLQVVRNQMVFLAHVRNIILTRWYSWLGLPVEVEPQAGLCTQGRPLTVLNCWTRSLAGSLVARTIFCSWMSQRLCFSDDQSHYPGSLNGWIAGYACNWAGSIAGLHAWARPQAVFNNCDRASLGWALPQTRAAG